MKPVLFLNILVLFFILPAGAQVKASKRAIREATEAEVAKYSLDANQTTRMEVIQTQRLTNLEAIEGLRQRDYDQYLAKKQAIRLYVEQATRRLLSDRQLPVLEQERRERERQRDQLQAHLKQEGASREATQRALLELEENW